MENGTSNPIMVYRIVARRNVDNVWTEVAQAQIGEDGVAAVDGIGATSRYAGLELRHENGGSACLYAWPRPPGKSNPPFGKPEKA